MKKLEDRLSRMLGKAQIEHQIAGVIARVGARNVGRETLVVIDPSFRGWRKIVAVRTNPKRSER